MIWLVEEEEKGVESKEALRRSVGQVLSQKSALAMVRDRVLLLSERTQYVIELIEIKGTSPWQFFSSNALWPQ
ncbi:hypothetical protein LguiA_014129 [Lonicera macranthoides]